MTGVVWPDGRRIESLAKRHRRRRFDCGEPAVNDWLATKALQHQEKRLSATKVLVDDAGLFVGFYTLAIGQIRFDELPAEILRKLPRRELPSVTLAWFGIEKGSQGQGLGRRLLSQALLDCHQASQTIPFVAVVLDCISDAAKTFYQQFGFREVPGHPYRLFLSAAELQSMAEGTA